LVFREGDFDTTRRFVNAVALSFAVHATLLALLFLSVAFSTRPTFIRPGDTVFVTPVNMPKKAPPPPPPAPEPPRIKKHQAPDLAKQTPKGKIVPMGTKTKPAPPPVKTKPEPPPPPIKKPEPAPAPQKPSSFRAEGVEFKYDYYVKIIKRKVEESWITHGLNTTGQLGNPEVYFKISKNGEVIDAQLEKSSGNGALDQSALNAVTRAKFPPLPSGYRRDYLGVYYNFEYVQKD